MKYWEIIADSLNKAGWSLGWVSTIDCKGGTIWIVDAHGYGKRFIRAHKGSAVVPRYRTLPIHHQALRCVKGPVAAHAGAGAVGSHNSEMVSMVCS